MIAMSKINRARTWGLALILIGMGIMIFGMIGIVYEWGVFGRILSYISMAVGTIAVMVSMGIYFWAGMISTNAALIQCPRCDKRTKMVGINDRCMYCHTRLSLDPKYKRDNEHVKTPSE